jgi:hypothetical protein
MVSASVFWWELPSALGRVYLAPLLALAKVSSVLVSAVSSLDFESVAESVRNQSLDSAKVQQLETW